LSFNDNCIDVTVSPTKPAEPVKYEVVPPTQTIKIVNNCVTGDKHAPEIKRGKGPYEYILSGTCSKTTTLPSKPVEDPSTFTADAFRTYLAARGITVHGQTLRAPVGAAEDAEVIATHVTPIAVELKRLNKSSQNFFAEAICKHTGFAYEHWKALPDQSASWKSGGEAIHNFLEINGIDHGELVVADGSGLSRENRVTARMLTDLLALMHRHVDGKVFFDSLPISGTDGTLRNRLKDIAGVVHAKTGSIGGVRALSGYIEKDGRTLIFSILANDIPGDEDKTVAKMDEAVREMAK
jgi:D-alanyl-D-alanine carboxypeptidase/D-alanyl-D-alanine-endopeptidase (penicillin-binding protein 4)